MSVAAAIEQQTAATQEIARNVAESGEAVQRITELIGEVTREANTTGQQADKLRDNAGAVASEVAALRTALVHTVRTATREADRRLEQRVAVDVPCSISFGATGAMLPARLRDISIHGAGLTIDPTRASAIDPTRASAIDPTRAAAVGKPGHLILTQSGNARAPFEVRTIGDAGHLHVRFIEDKVDLDVQRGRLETDGVRAAAGEGGVTGTKKRLGFTPALPPPRPAPSGLPRGRIRLPRHGRRDRHLRLPAEHLRE